MTDQTTQTTQTAPEGFRLNAAGNMIHLSNVRPIDLARDEIVIEVIEKAKSLSGLVAKFKSSTLDDIQAFVELSADRYDVKRGGRKGNVTLTSFDGRYQIQRSIADRLEFDEGLQAAKALIDECLIEWSEGARPEIRTIIQDAFATDKKGNLATHKILSLRRLKIEDPRWKRAMDAIGDSLQITGSKSYITFYQRDKDGKYIRLSLDPTELK